MKKGSETKIIKRSQINLNPCNPKVHTDADIKQQKANIKKQIIHYIMWGNNKTTRWTVLLIVAIIMMMGYVFWDIVSPLTTNLKSPLDKGGMNWTTAEYGFYAGSSGQRYSHGCDLPYR